MLTFIARARMKAISASGFVSSGSGMAGGTVEGGLGAVVVNSLIGAFVGLLLGLMLSHLFRFLSMMWNRNLGGYSWVIYGAVLGAAVFAFMTIKGEDS